MGWRGVSRGEEGLSSGESTPQRVRSAPASASAAISLCRLTSYQFRWVDRERNLGRLDTSRTVWQDTPPRGASSWQDTPPRSSSTWHDTPPRTAEAVRRGAPPPALRAASLKFQACLRWIMLIITNVMIITMMTMTMLTMMMFIVQARFASSEESSACSSVLSSLESVESNTSEGRNDVTIHSIKGSIIAQYLFLY